MLTMLLSLTLGVCIFASFHFGAGISVVWAVVWAFVSMFVFQLCAALLIQKEKILTMKIFLLHLCL